MTRSNPIFVITYRDAQGVTYSEISRAVGNDLERINREIPGATIVCVDRQVGYW